MTAAVLDRPAGTLTVADNPSTRPPGPGLGCEVPRIFTPPARQLTPQTSLGFEAIQFAEDILGISLFPWQKWLLIHALELHPDGSGRFRFRTVVVLVARQNGKTTLVNVLTLWRMYADYARLVIGTAQNLDVAEESWDSCVELAEGVEDTAAEIVDVVKVNGKKALVLTDKRRYKVQAANRRGGRGLTADLIILDELREHQKWDAWSAVSKTKNARPKGQVWAMSNAGDESSVVLTHLRTRAIEQIDAGQVDGAIGLFEWSSAPGAPVTSEPDLLQANPSCGYGTITLDVLLEDAGTDPEDVFRTECMCQWVTQIDPTRITEAMWEALLDPGSRMAGAPVVAVVVRRDRSSASLTAVGRRADGLHHVEWIEAKPGTSWLVDRCVGLVRKQRATIVLAGDSVSLEHQLVERKLEPVILGPAERSRAATQFYDQVKSGGLRHTGGPVLTGAVLKARRRVTASGWEWEPPDATAEVMAVQGASAALWAAVKGAAKAPPNVW